MSAKMISYAHVGSGNHLKSIDDILAWDTLQSVAIYENWKTHF